MKLWYDIVNEPPYVKRITINQKNGIEFGAHWENKENIDTGERTREYTIDFTRLDDFSIPPISILNGTAKIDIEFSKPVEGVYVGLTGTTEIWDIANGKLDESGKIWHGEIYWNWYAGKKVLSTFGGNQKLVIQAKDKNNHYKREAQGLPEHGYELDTSPETIAVCNSVSPYEWNKYEMAKTFILDKNPPYHLARPADTNIDLNIINIPLNNEIKPDETVAVGGVRMKAEGGRQNEGKIKVLVNGFFDECISYLKSLNIEAGTISVNADYSELTGVSLVIIPTGGLTGLGESEQMHEIFTTYTASGGTILCFSQAQGEDYNVLPGINEGLFDTTLSSQSRAYFYGFQTDMSCWMRSVVLGQYHPVLAGMENKTPNIEIDGFIYRAPENANIILSRTANYYPAYIVYKTGNQQTTNAQGSIVITNQYSDWGLAHSQTSHENSRLIKDTISWLVSPKMYFDTIKPVYGSSITYNYNMSIEKIVLKNESYDTAYYAKVWIDDPEGNNAPVWNNNNPIYNNIIDLTNAPIPPYNSTNISANINLNIDSTWIYGIYNIGYELGKNSTWSSTAIITENKWAGSFGLHKDIKEKYNTTNITVTLVSDKDDYVKGEIGTFTAIIRNKMTDKPAPLYCEIYVEHTGWIQNSRKEVTVPPGGEEKFDIKAGPMDKTGTFFCSIKAGYDLAATRKFTVYDRQVEMEIKPDRKVYLPYETAKIEIEVKNNLYINPGALRVETRILNDLNAEKWNAYNVINSIDALSIAKIYESTTFDPGWMRGKYYIESRTYDGGLNVIGYDIKTIDYSETRIEITGTPDFSHMTWKETNPLTFNITNTGGTKCSGGEIAISMYSQNGGDIIANNIVNIPALDTGNSISVTGELSIDWSRFSEEKYRIYYTLRYDNRAYTYSVEIDAFKYLVKNKFDSAWYRQKDTLSGITTVNYLGNIEDSTEIKFKILNIPELAAWETSWMYRYGRTTRSKENTYKYNILIPENINKGVYDIELKVTKNGTDLRSCIDRFIIPGFRLSSRIIGYESTSNSEIIEIANSGGIRGKGEYKIELRDNTDYPVMFARYETTLNVRDKIEKEILFPDGLRTGKYYFKLNAYDSINFGETKWDEMNITGISANLTALPVDSTIYNTTSAKVKVEIKSTSNLSINNSKLKIKIGKPNIALVPPDEIDTTFTFTIKEKPNSFKMYKFSNNEEWIIWEMNGDIYLNSKFKIQNLKIVAGGNNHEPVMIEDKSHKLWLVYRKNNSIWYSTTNNYGTSWAEIQMGTKEPEKEIVSGTNPKIIEVGRAGSSGSEILIFYLRQDKEIAYRSNIDNFTEEEIVPLPKGYKSSFDVLVDSSTQIWLSYVGEDRNIYYTKANINAGAGFESARSSIAWQGNYLSATGYARENKIAVAEAEEMILSGKSKGVTKIEDRSQNAEVITGVKLSTGYEAGWMESEEISLPDVAEILSITPVTHEPFYSSTPQLKYRFSVGEKLYDSVINKPMFKVREGWPKKLYDDYWLFTCNPAVGDIDGDGEKEVIINTRKNLYSWNGDGTKYDSLFLNPYNTGFGGFSVVLDDFNQDGIDERAITSPSGNQSKISIINKYKQNIFDEIITHYSQFSIHSGDITGDGKPDLLAFTELPRGYSGHYYIDLYGLHLWDVANKKKIDAYYATTATEGYTLPYMVTSYCGGLGTGLFDVDNDGAEEVIAYNDTGWLKTYDTYYDTNNISLRWKEIKSLYNSESYTYYPGLAVGNMLLESESTKIVKFSNYFMKIYDVKMNGQCEQNSWYMPGRDMGQISLGDIDGDGKLEIMLLSGRSQGGLFDVINLDGKKYNFPLNLPEHASHLNFPMPQAITGDINGDGEQEIIIASGDKMYGYHNTGEVIKNFPMRFYDSARNIYDPVYFNGARDFTNCYVPLPYNSPILTDLDDDGKLEIVAAGTIKNFNQTQWGRHPVIYVIDTNAWYDEENIEWAQFGANKKHNGRYGDNKGKFWYKLQYAKWANLEDRSQTSEDRGQKTDDRIKLKAEFFKNGMGDSTLPVLDKFNIAYLAGIKGVNPHIIELPDGRKIVAYKEKGQVNYTWKYAKLEDSQPILPIALTDKDIQNVNFSWIGDELYEVWCESDSTGYTFKRGKIEGAGIDSSNIFYTYESTIPAIAGGESISYTVDFGKIPESGNYLIEAELKSDFGQKISENQSEIIVMSESGIAIRLDTDKKFYSSGENVNIDVTVTNNGINTYNGDVKVLKITDITPDGIEIYSQNVTLTPGEIYQCTTGTIAEENFQLIAKANPYALRNIKIAKPEIQAYIDAPQIAGRESFPVTLRLYNPAEMEIKLNIAISNEQRAMSNNELVIKPEEWQIVKNDMNIQADTIITYQISCNNFPSINKTIQKEIKFGEKTEIVITPEYIYPEGKISIPYRMKNTGELFQDAIREIEIRNKANEIILHNKAQAYIAKDGSINDNVIFTSYPGQYELKIKFGFDSSIQGINVLPKEKAEIEKVNIGNCIDGLVPINFNICNTGYNNIGGQIKIKTGFYSESRSINISNGEEKWYTFRLNPQGVSGGKYPLSINVESGSGINFAYDTSIEISGYEFTAIPVTQNPEYTAGAEGVFAIRVKNIGDRWGKAGVTIKMGSFYEETKTVLLETDQSKEEEINFKVPDDIPEGEYKVEVKIENKKDPVIIPFRVKGLTLEVKAELDNNGYRINDSLKLRLDITNHTTSISPKIYINVKYDTTDIERDVSLTGINNQLEFNINLSRITGQKLFVGIYDGNTHRSIYLNELYVREAGEIINVFVDKQVYSPGDIVNITIQNADNGEITLIGPADFKMTKQITAGETKEAFTLGRIIPAGQYFIQYNYKIPDGDNKFEEITGSTAFDISGINLEILYSGLEKNKYSSKDTIRGTLIIKSSSMIKTNLIAWVNDPEGNNTNLSNGEYNIRIGENEIKFSGEFNTQIAGIHKVLYLIQEKETGEYLTGGSFTIEAGNMNLSGIKLETEEYPYGTEPVNIMVYTYGINGVSGDMDIVLDTTTIQTKQVQTSGINGYKMELTQDKIIPGKHIITVKLRSGELTSEEKTGFDYGTKLPDLIIKKVSVDNAIEEGYKKIKVEIEKQRELQARNIEVKAETQNFASVRTIGETIIPELIENGAKTNVEFIFDSSTFSLQSSSFNLIITVDPENMIREYDESNNIRKEGIYIPAAPVINELPLSTNQKDIKITGTADAYSLIKIYCNGKFIGEAYADGEGNFEYIITLKEGKNTITAEAYNSKGEKSFISLAYTTLFDTALPPPEPECKLNINSSMNKEYKKALVYLGHDAEYDSGTIAKILDSTNAGYSIIKACRNTFRSELRSGQYNMYIIDNASKHDEKKCNVCGIKVSSGEWKDTMYELSEAVYRGDGFIFIKTDPETFYPGLFKNLLGVKGGGYKDKKELTLRVTDTTWHDNLEIELASDIFEVKPTSGIIRADLEFYNKTLKEKVWPAIVTNNYGRGKTVTLTYEPENSLDVENKAKCDMLMKTMIKYLEPDEIKAEPFEMIPVNVSVKADKACDLILWGNHQDNLSLKNTDGQITSPHDIRWNVNILDSTEIKNTQSIFILPDEKGTSSYSILTQYKNGDNWHIYNTTTINLEIKEIIEEKLDRTKLCVENLEINENDEDEHEIKEYIIYKLNLIKNRGKNSIDDIERSINDLIDCIKKIEKLEEEGTSLLIEIQKIHFELSYIMQGYEGMYSRKIEDEPPVSDTVPPEIITKYPDNLSLNIKSGAIINAIFSEDMDSSSVNTNTFYIEDRSQESEDRVEGRVNYNNRIVTFTPTNLLEPNTTYTATITKGVKDISGNYMAEDYIWSFITINPEVEIIFPEILSASPYDGGIDIVRDTTISAVFSKDMDTSSINGSTFYIEDRSQESEDRVEGRVNYNNRIVTFTPTNLLEPNTTYTVTITKGVKDISGNYMAGDYIWNFITEKEPDIIEPPIPDTIPPEIISTNPENNAAYINPGIILSAVFSEKIDNASIKEDSFILQNVNNNIISGQLLRGTKSIVFIPYNNLEYNMGYKVKILSGIKDLSGNKITEDYIWSFSTPDKIFPEVLSVSPADGTKDVLCDTKINVKFTKAMDTSTINMNTFILKDIKNNTVPGSFIFTDTTFVFIPSAPFKESMIYIAEIKSEIKDKTGNNLLKGYIWNFSIKEYGWIKAASGTSHTIAIKSNGALFTCGANNFGQLGDGTNTNKNTPVQIGADNEWLEAAGGVSHTVAIKTNGTLWAWGKNDYGQLGDGTLSNRNAPVQITNDGNWLKIASGWYHNTAIKTDGTLWGWGYNYYGQLGDGTNVTRYSPVQIGTNNNWLKAAAGTGYTMAIKTDGTLWAWGYNNYGQLGDGTNTNKSVPVQIGTGTDWTEIACGSDRSAGIKSNGTLWMWGYGINNIPVQTGTDRNWSKVVCSQYHTVAIKTDGTLWAWGSNDYGQLGDGTNIDKSTPAQIGTLNNWSLISAGYEYTIALTSDGSIFTWGRNISGQLGDGTTVNKNKPIEIGQDTLRPMIISNNPQNNLQNIALSTTIGVRFSDEMDISSLNPDTFTVYTGGIKVIGTVVYNNNEAVFIPEILHPDTKYTAVITTGVKDSSGNALKENYIWSFKTIDTMPPEIVSAIPCNNAIGAAPDTIIRVKFSDFMDSSSINENTFILKARSGDITHGTIAYNGLEAKFTPVNILAPYVNYYLEINGIKDKAGNLVETEIYTFKTGSMEITPAWIKIGKGADFTAALKSDGTLFTWENNNNGQLSDGTK
ncbi:Ig-like domain-containing protein [Candidatus Desantisbacteria bacterium]|nr:Ig-like domain-containing protein [Candidatus Desantisbacteria bacterium]